VDAGDEFLAAGGTAKFENNGTTNKTVEQDMPLEVTKSTGTVIVQSHVNAFIKGSTVATKPYAIDIGSDGLTAQLRLGVMNPGDTSDGNASITTFGAGATGGAGKADVRVGGSAIFEADGVNNGLYMRGTADATMTVNGILYLGNTNALTSFEKSSLNIGSTTLTNKNNLTFGNNGTFSFSVQFPTGGVGKDQDQLAVLSKSLSE
jgi:hypothetical protein